MDQPQDVSEEISPEVLGQQATLLGSSSPGLPNPYGVYSFKIQLGNRGHSHLQSTIGPFPISATPQIQEAIYELHLSDDLNYAI